MLEENFLLWSASVLSLVTQSCRAGVAVCKPERGFKKWSGHAIRRPQLMDKFDHPSPGMSEKSVSSSRTMRHICTSRPLVDGRAAFKSQRHN